MWEWWDNTVDSVSEAVGDAWDTVGEWASDTADTVSAWAGEAWNWANEAVDTYIWDATDKGAVVESWVRDTFDIPDQEGKGFVEEATETVVEEVTTFVDNTTTTVSNAAGAVTSYVNTVTQRLGDIINDIQITLGVGMEAAWAALGGLPDLLSQMFSINLENFVEDGLKLYAANKALVERIKAEEGIE